MLTEVPTQHLPNCCFLHILFLFRSPTRQTDKWTDGQASTVMWPIAVGWHHNRLENDCCVTVYVNVC